MTGVLLFSLDLLDDLYHIFITKNMFFTTLNNNITNTILDYIYMYIREKKDYIRLTF